MAKKTLALLLSLLLLLPVLAGTAEDAAEKEAIEKLNVLVIDYLKSNNYKYTFDGENRFELEFSLDNALKSCTMAIYTYYDGITFSAWPGFTVKQENREKTATYLALVNLGRYYGQFYMDYENGDVFCRAFHLAEETLPGLKEVDVLLHQQLFYLEDYGEGLMAVAVDGADPVTIYTKVEAGEPLSEFAVSATAEAQNSQDQTDDVYLLSGTYDGVFIGLKEVLAQEEGDDKILILVFDFSHDKDEAQMFSLAANIMAYQDGIELDDAYFYKHTSQGNSLKNIKKGAVLETTKAYKLRSNSPVEIEMNEFFSFNDRKPDAITVPVP